MNLTIWQAQRGSVHSNMFITSKMVKLCFSWFFKAPKAKILDRRMLHPLVYRINLSDKETSIAFNNRGKESPIAMTKNQYK